MTTDPRASATDFKELDRKVAPVRWAALAMFVFYGVTILSSLVPLQLRNPLWHQNAVNVLVNNSVIPLVGLTLLQLLLLLQPDLRPTRTLLKATSRWALAAAVGFVLLVPLQGAVALKLLKQAGDNDLAQSLKAREQISRMRAAVGAAGSSQELLRTMPALRPPDAQQLAQLPLAEARAKVLTNLDRGEASIKPELVKAQARQRWAAGREASRNIIAALALAAGFFSLRLRSSAF